MRRIGAEVARHQHYTIVLERVERRQGESDEELTARRKKTAHVCEGARLRMRPRHLRLLRETCAVLEANIERGACAVFAGAETAEAAAAGATVGAGVPAAITDAEVTEVTAAGAAVAGAAVEVANVDATKYGHETGFKHCAAPS